MAFSEVQSRRIIVSPSNGLLSAAIMGEPAPRRGDPCGRPGQAQGLPLHVAFRGLAHAIEVMAFSEVQSRHPGEA
jgi:hypothetical protein